MWQLIEHFQETFPLPTPKPVFSGEESGHPKHDSGHAESSDFSAAESHSQSSLEERSFSDILPEPGTVHVPSAKPHVPPRSDQARRRASKPPPIPPKPAVNPKMLRAGFFGHCLDFPASVTIRLSMRRDSPRRKWLRAAHQSHLEQKLDWGARSPQRLR